MKKTDEQLRQEIIEIRRFVDGDSRDVAIKARVMEEPHEFGDAFLGCTCGAISQVSEMHRNRGIYCWKCGQKLDWSDAHEIN